MDFQNSGFLAKKPSRLAILKRLLAVMRLPMAFLCGLSAICGLKLSGAAMDTATITQLFCVGFITAAGGFLINDIYDAWRDKGQENKPIAQGHLNARLASVVSVALVLSAVVISWTLGIAWLLLTISHFLLIRWYSEIKASCAFLSNMVTGALCASGIIYGSLTNVTSEVLVISVAALVFITGRELLKDIVDMEQDRRMMILTMPVLYSVRVARNCASILFFSSAALLLFSMNIGALSWNHRVASATLLVIPAVWSLFIELPTDRALTSSLNISAIVLFTSMLTLATAT